MPLFIGEFDYIVGNPPWVNWQSLPSEYRLRTKPLWQKYRLFEHQGFDAILGKSKDDISILMTYVAASNYLKSSGTLGFVITQSVFKTVGAGVGFRRFQLGDGDLLQVVHVDDLSELQPFEGARNRTAVVMLQKGRPTRYPVPYTFWRKAVKGKRAGYDSNLDEVVSLVHRLEFQAVPIDENDLTSPWITARPQALRALQKVIGASDYEAHAGLYSGGANAVYWLEVLSERPERSLIIRNITAGAKRVVERVTTEVESSLVFPLLRGRDVQRWTARPSAHVLVTHEQGRRLKAIPESAMQSQYPKTYMYLKPYEAILAQRAAFKRYFTRNGQPTGPFYSMFNVGDYTFAPYKVVWREQTSRASGLTCSIVGPHHGSIVMPDHKLMMVECSSEQEAGYLCSALNSTPARLAVWAYAIEIQQDTHILEHISVPRFEPGNEIHRTLAELGLNASNTAGTDLRVLEGRIDQAAADLWRITPRELEEIGRSLAEVTAPLVTAPLKGAVKTGDA